MLKLSLDDRIKNIMSIVFDVPVDALNEKSTPNTVENWDSLNHMKLVLALEEEFNIQINEQDALDLQSFKLIKHILSGYLEKVR